MENFSKANSITNIFNGRIEDISFDNANTFITISYSDCSNCSVVQQTIQLLVNNNTRILDENGLKNVKVVEVAGNLSDHYDPKEKIVRLSTDIYNNTSLASVAVASHECGHAIQDKNNYTFLRIRSSIVPLVNIASRAGYIIIVISFMMSLMKLLWVGILMEFVILAFQVITLPVEFNASNRALKQIKELKIVDEEEHVSCKSMLTAAALTYVASVASAIIEIVRLLFILNRRR